MPKVLIASADPTIKTWKSLPSKIRALEKTLNTIQNGTFTVDIHGVYVQPEVQDGRITHAWFNTFSYPLYRQGYDFVVFHMGDKQRTQWGIKPSLRGSSQIDNDFVGEMYIWADENTKRNGLNQFIETTLHEIRHELCRGCNLPDDTHAIHDKGTITKSFSVFNMENYLPTRIELLKKQLSLLEQWLSLLKPLSPFFKQTYPITQPFGAKNAIYKQTGTHIGTDYGTPMGTIVYAPTIGVLRREEGKETGIMATFQTNNGTFQFLHLSHCAPSGTYKRGYPIGVTGNTGLSTGPHCCVRLWKGTPNISILTKNNIHEYLLDVSKVL